MYFFYFNSLIKRVKQCCCTLILLPKLTLNANLTTTNRFFTNDDWQRGRFENFELDHQYESNLESDVRFEIESNHDASQVPKLYRLKVGDGGTLTVTGPECLGLCCLTETVLFLVASCQSVQEFTCSLCLSSVSLSESCLCVFSRRGQPMPLFLPVSLMFLLSHSFAGRWYFLSIFMTHCVILWYFWTNYY